MCANCCSCSVIWLIEMLKEGTQIQDQVMYKIDRISTTLPIASINFKNSQEYLAAEVIYPSYLCVLISRTSLRGL